MARTRIRLAAPASPAIDVGYTALPGTNFIDLVLTVDKSVSPQVVSTASGSTTVFTLDVKSYDFPVDGITIADALPGGWEFVTDSATITLADKTQLIGAAANPTITGAGPYTLTWPTSLLGSLAANQEITVVFTGRTTQVFAVGDLSRNLVNATGTRTVEGVTQTFNAWDSVFVSYGNLTISKTTGGTDPLSPGDQYTYTVVVTSPAAATGDLTGIAIYDPLPNGVGYVASSSSVTAPNRVSPIRATEYYLGAGNFTGTTYDLTLNQDLASDYFVIIRGADGDGTANTNTGPDSNYPALTADPIGTGDLAASGATNTITLTRHASPHDWIGVVTVVECVNNQATDGFRLLSVERVPHPSGGTGSTDTSAAAWTDINQVMLMGGFNGAGCDTTEASNNNMVTCWARIWPTGTDTINWSRNAGGATLSAATSTVMVVSWGSNWTVQRLEVTGTNGGDGVNAAGEYNTAPLGTSVTRANTWIWGTGFTNNNGLGDGAEGVVVTLGDGVTQNATESTVAVATEYVGTSIDFEVYALTHANIAVDYRFKADADTTALTVDVPVDSATSNRIALSYNTCNGTGTAYPRPLFSARYTSNTNVRLERRRSGQPFAAWVQGIEFSIPVSGTSVYPGHTPPNFVRASDGFILSPGETLTLTYDVTVDNPLATGIDTITNTASVTTAEIKTPISDSATNIVTNPSAASAKAGDRVWLDTNGDGVQDVGEPGLSNVTVTLKDQYGTPIATATTDGNGNYLFDGVTPDTGYYVEVTAGLPSGLVQSWPAGHSDNKTDPFDLIAGQTYLDADLGYTGAPGTATLGDFVWSDADGDQAQDAGEPGISGVTVELYLDDGDGVFEPGAGPGNDGVAVATAVTGTNGNYLFTGVTASGTEDYWIAVDTSQAILTGYTATTATLRSVTSVNAGDVLLTYDFGFQNPNTYSIRDRVWYDLDEDGNDDNATVNAESGISGVTVDLLDASLNVIASTTTDANGYFTFSGLVGNGADYTVKITDTSGKLTDYFGTTVPAQAGDLAVNNLIADIDYSAEPSEPNFGYSVAGTIGDTVFNDIGGTSGVQDTGEPGISSVTVDLYLDNGNGVFEPGGADGSALFTLTTDSSGQYLFSGLNDGTYWVDIDNTQPALTSYDLLTTADDDGSAAGHQRLVTIVGGGSDLTIDYGYRASVQRSVSGTLWSDADQDGILDVGELGISGVTIDLLDGVTVINSTTTDANGDYSFTGLPSGTYTVRITDNSGVLTDYTTTFEVSEGANTPPYNGEESVNLTGGNVTNIDFGYYKPTPTYALISSFTAKDSGGRVRVTWKTSAEVGCAGFYLQRKNGSGAYQPVSKALVPSVMSPAGGTYSMIDPDAVSGVIYTYRLIELESSGRRRVWGPFTVTVAPSDGGAISTLGTAAYIAMPRTREPAARDGQNRLSLSRHLYRSAGPATPLAQVKLITSASGIYALSAAYIAAGLGISEDEAAGLVSSGRIYLTSNGAIVPMLPFADNTGIYFYARQQESIYTDKTVFWLFADYDGEKGDVNGDGKVNDADFAVCISVLNGLPAPTLRPDYPESGADVNGNRTIDMAEAAYISAIVHRNIKSAMATAPALPVSGDIQTIIPAVRHYEQDLFDKTDLFSDPNADYWFWTFVIPGDSNFGSATLPIMIDAPASGGSAANLHVNLYGVVNYPGGPDYHARLMLNGTLLGEYTWDGLTPHTLTASVDSSLLIDGENTLAIEGVAGDPATPGIFAVDSVDLEYERMASAKDDRLDILPGTAGPVRVSGFSGPDILALDIADPAHPARISGISATGSGTAWNMDLMPENKDKSYALAGPGGAMTPEIAASHVRPELKTSPGADYLIIAGDDLASGAQTLADYRAARGFTPMVVTVSEVYDTFGHGVKDPGAIAVFIKYAYKKWALVPKYVVLVGDGTYDYKDHLGTSDNLVPVLMTPTSEGLFASDTLFVDSDDDKIPDIPIGRIAVTTDAELSAAISKIEAFEAGSGGRNILMVADRADDGGDFPAASDTVAALVPDSLFLERIYLAGSVSAAEARAQLIDGINTGAFILNYIGHGGIDRISNSSLLKSGDESLLDNAGHYPIAVTLTCLAGQFSVPGLDSLVEEMMAAPGKGFVAGWAPTGLSQNSGAVDLNKDLFTAMFADNAPDLGTAVINAIRKYRVDGGSAGLPMVYNLLGDPALDIR
ncbi:MAG: hypothetical protein GXP53_01115 [Deltaproteobacteria bacterium]|nr:hypothetical protein [Deltaproteobacteria bacterium]